jgi:hypothetical protein
MRKYSGPIMALLMWASGTGLVLITLSGAALSKAMFISAVTLAINVIAIIAGIGFED